MASSVPAGAPTAVTPTAPPLRRRRRASHHHRDALQYRHLLRSNSSKDPKHLKQIHAQILRRNLHGDPALLAGLIRLYSSSQQQQLLLPLASRAFQMLSPPTTFACNLIIRAHSLNAQPRGAILLYNQMMTVHRLPPDKFTFPFAAAACSLLPDLAKAKEIHASAIKARLYDDTYLHNTLIHLYFSCRDAPSAAHVFDTMPVRTVVSWTALVSGLIACGDLDAARSAFDAAPVRNVVTWTAMIDGYARSGRPEEAFHLFRRMMQEDGNVQPNEFTLVSLLTACTEVGSLRLGRWVHEFAQKMDHTRRRRLDTGLYVGTALIDMYSKCGSLEDAVRVFHQMPDQSLATWNLMITSLGMHRRGREAIALFRAMERADVRPDGITLAGVLCACVRARMVEEGCRLFAYMRKYYGIDAGFEHYKCLVELLGYANGSEEACGMLKDLATELDVESQRILLAACRAHGNVELEEVVCGCSSIHEEMKV